MTTAKKKYISGLAGIHFFFGGVGELLHLSIQELFCLFLKWIICHKGEELVGVGYLQL